MQTLTSTRCDAEVSGGVRRACGQTFEATQIAGFGHEESLRLFGAPPAGYALTIEPMAVSVAEARYLERYQVLSEAAGYVPAAQAFKRLADLARGWPLPDGASGRVEFFLERMLRRPAPRLRLLK